MTSAKLPAWNPCWYGSRSASTGVRRRGVCAAPRACVGPRGSRKRASSAMLSGDCAKLQSCAMPARGDLQSREVIFRLRYTCSLPPRFLRASSFSASSLRPCCHAALLWRCGQRCARHGCSRPLAYATPRVTQLRSAWWLRSMTLPSSSPRSPQCLVHNSLWLAIVPRSR